MSRLINFALDYEPSKRNGYACQAVGNSPRSRPIFQRLFSRRDSSHGNSNLFFFFFFFVYRPVLLFFSFCLHYRLHSLLLSSTVNDRRSRTHEPKLNAAYSTVSRPRSYAVTSRNFFYRRNTSDSLASRDRRSLPIP